MSVIDRLPMRITSARCPACDKFAAVDNGHDGARFVDHKNRKRKPCPQSSQPIPSLSGKAGR